MFFSTMILSALAATLTTTVVAMPAQVVSGNEVTGTKCTDTSIAFNTHDTNVAILGICGGIAGAITKCGGNPVSTVGQSGTSKFTLTATDSGSTINVSKGRWERCVKAAQLTCPQGSFETTCLGGATPSGDIKVTLTKA